MQAKDYRQQAWDRLRGNWGAAILAFLLYGLIIGALSYTGVGTLILGGPLMVGLVAVFLQLTRTGTTKIEYLFNGITTGFVNKMLGKFFNCVYNKLSELRILIAENIVSELVNKEMSDNLI